MLQRSQCLLTCDEDVVGRRFTSMVGSLENEGISSTTLDAREDEPRAIPLDQLMLHSTKHKHHARTSSSSLRNHVPLGLCLRHSRLWLSLAPPNSSEVKNLDFAEP